MSAPILDTPRLLLLPYSLDHVDALHELWSDPEVRRFLWDDRIISRDTAVEVVTASIADWNERGFGQWVITVKPSPAVAGFVGLRPNDRRFPELLYGLHPRHWHHGLAFDAAQAVLRHAFTELGLAEVWAATDRPNRASIRLLERLGMALETPRADDGAETLSFRLSAAEYASR